ncbi:peroxiredoxin 1 [Savitreella phatthalungensis]
MSLRLGSTAPNFDAETTNGKLNLHEYLGNSWGILFSHPADFTPVCTTELGEIARLEPEFAKRNVKLIGLSANDVEKHGQWVSDINELSQTSLSFPIIGDQERKVALAYDMIDQEDATNVDEKGIAFTIRSVFFIDPAKKIRTILQYPASVGRNSNEILRVIDALQYGDKRKVTTPINWQPGQKTIIPPTVKTGTPEYEAYPQKEEVKSYLRFTKFDD